MRAKPMRYYAAMAAFGWLAIVTSAAASEPPEDGAMAQPEAATEAIEDEEYEEEPTALAPTRVLSTDGVARLRTVQGITLQWIGWDERGQVEVRTDDNGIWWINGEQRGERGARVSVQGHIVEIGEDYFLLDGNVTIGESPTIGRSCSKDQVWRFAVTQNRKYWRLREFEWCDRLTDYIDIYF